MASRILLLVVILSLLLSGLALARSSAWTPFAPAPLPASEWAPQEDGEPTHWQTLDHIAFDAGGGSFVAELQGFPRMTSGGVHSLVVRIVRTGGDDAPLQVRQGLLDGSSFERVEQREEDIEVRFAYQPPAPGAHALEAGLEVRAWRAVAWGYREAEPVQLALRADVERRDAT